MVAKIITESPIEVAGESASHGIDTLDAESVMSSC